MSNELVKYQTDHGEVTLSPQIIRNYLVSPGTNVTDQEVLLFLRLCEYQKLNPFIREAYLVKYGNNPASFVTGKDVFTKRADDHPKYAGKQAGIIVQDNKGTVIKREGSMRLNGETLLGGWAKVYIKDHQVPDAIEVSIDEYTGAGPLWKTKPATMIRKVALVQALREAFPKEFEGLYSQEEINTVDASLLPETPVEIKDITDQCEVVATVQHDEAPVSEPEPAQPREPADTIEKAFLTDVQYRVEKAEKGKTKTNNKDYVKLLIKEAGFTLELYDYECHAVNEGDFIFIRSMRPIKSREYNGKTYYSTSGTIDVANTVSAQSFEDDTPLPFDV